MWAEHVCSIFTNPLQDIMCGLFGVPSSYVLQFPLCMNLTGWSFVASWDCLSLLDDRINKQEAKKHIATCCMSEEVREFSMMARWSLAVSVLLIGDVI